MTDDLDTTYRIPRPGEPCVCGAIVLAGEVPARFATNDSCRLCGMAARWQRRVPRQYRQSHVCGLELTAPSVVELRQRMIEHADQCPETPLGRMYAGHLGMEIEVRTRQEWIDAGVMEP